MGVASVTPYFIAVGNFYTLCRLSTISVDPTGHPPTKLTKQTNPQKAHPGNQAFCNIF
jgi:hypothetical protein